MATRILIVDDHPLTREALSSLLVSHGFDVVGTASDGADAIVEAERLRPDIVLLELSMPGMDGLNALPQIRATAPECEGCIPAPPPTHPTPPPTPPPPP